MSSDTSFNETTEKIPLELTVEVKKVSSCQRHVTVTIPRADIDRYFREQYDQIAPMAAVPGFRPGRAPRQLLENRFRPQVADKVKGTLILDSLNQIADRQDYSAISEPDFDFEQVQVPESGDMKYEFNIEVRPEFATPQWKGLVLERLEHTIGEEDVDRMLAEMSAEYVDLVPVEAPVAADDVVICDITCRLDNKVVSRDTERSIQVRPTLSFSDCTVENFARLMIGAKAGETRATRVTVSEFSENEKLKGQAVDIEFKVLDVKRLDATSYPDVMQRAGFGPIDKLRESIRERLQRQLEYAQRERIRNQIARSLIESADWDLPPDLLRRQSRRELDRAVMELRSSGFSESDIIARENVLRKNILERTERLLKEHFILEKIAEEESIEETPIDQDLEIQRIASQQNDSPRRVRAYLERHGQLDALRNMIVERKVIEMITEHATFKSVPYEVAKKETTTALTFFVGGEPEVEIPEAKYEDSSQLEPLPGSKKERE